MPKAGSTVRTLSNMQNVIDESEFRQQLRDLDDYELSKLYYKLNDNSLDSPWGSAGRTKWADRRELVSNEQQRRIGVSTEY